MNDRMKGAEYNDWILMLFHTIVFYFCSFPGIVLQLSAAEIVSNVWSLNYYIYIFAENGIKSAVYRANLVFNVCHS